MTKNHANALDARLEEVIDRGVAHVLWGELYRWYDAKRIAINIWRDIVERWEEIADETDHGSLKMVDGAGGIFLFAEKTIKPLV